MNKPFSIYLDLVRFTAACLVYLYHSNQRWLVSDILPASNYGHSAVIIFFVLSGFVIAFITDTREKTFVSYASSRISRIYSVALPSIFLTIIFDAIGRQFYPAIYAYPFDNFLVRGVASSLMLNEIWFVSITSFSNVPYWSIGYEMWYYVGFALITFAPKRLRLIAVVTLALILGPKIVLLAPIWYLGVVLYRWKRLEHISIGWAWVFLIVSSVGLIAFHQAKITDEVASITKGLVGVDWHAQFTFSKFFPSDYLLGILVFLNFAGMRRIAPSIQNLFLIAEAPIRYLANFTLTLYLLHQPLFLFWGAVIRGDPNGYAFWWSTTAMVAISVFGIGYITENKRYALKKWVERFLIRIEALLGQRNARIG